MKLPLSLLSLGLLACSARPEATPARTELAAPLMQAPGPWASGPRERAGWHPVAVRERPEGLELLVGTLPTTLPEAADPALVFDLQLAAPGGAPPRLGQAGRAVFVGEGLYGFQGTELRDLRSGRVLAADVDDGGLGAGRSTIAFLRGYPADELWLTDTDGRGGRLAAGLSPAWAPAVDEADPGEAAGRVVLVSGASGRPRWWAVTRGGAPRELPLPADTPIASGFAAARLRGDELLFEDEQGAWRLHLVTGARRYLAGGRAPLFGHAGPGALVAGAWRAFEALP